MKLENDCNIRPNFNLPDKKQGIYCSTHKKENMVDVISVKCKFELCQTRANYNYINNKTPLYCIKHKLEDMVDVKNKYFNCTSCNLRYRENIKNQTLCSYCNPTKQINNKELKIKKLLIDNNYIENKDFINNKQCNNTNECNKYRPDFLFDCNSYFVILEVDEFQHKSYDSQCELTRMNNICFNLGLPCIFIRYNPDNKEYSTKIKHLKLLEKLKEFLNYNFNEAIKIDYLFYS